MKVNRIEVKDLLDIEKDLGCEIEVNERPGQFKKHLKYYAHIKNLEVKDGYILSGAFGNGETVEEALSNYAEEISEKLVVLDAYKDSRKVIQFPKIVFKGEI